jgi:membrane protease YdiL (CAAX protease family)
VYAAIVSMLTIMGEELGWRGFLQDALRPLARSLRYALIGIMWELWHFTNRTHDRPLFAVLLTLSISYPALIALSWIIGEAVERSRSLLVAHTIHLWIDHVADFPSWQSFVTAVVAVAVWIILLLRWPQRQEPTRSTDDPDLAALSAPSPRR